MVQSGCGREGRKGQLKTNTHTPQLQDGGGVIHGGVDASYEVQVAHVQTPVAAASQRHWRQQLVALGNAAAAGAGDAPPPAIAHNAADERGLLGQEDVLSTSFMKDA